MKNDAWLYFGLSYAHWLVLPRIALQSMPEEWQQEFFDLVDELEDRVIYPEGWDEITSFSVTARKGNKFVKHVLPHYKHHNLELKK